MLPAILKEDRPDQPVKRGRKRKRLSRPEMASAIEMHVKGIKTGVIAKALGVSRHYIIELIQSFKPLLEATKNVEDYEAFRGKLLAAGEYELLKSVTEAQAIERAPLQQRAYAFTQIHNARRLESGQSTANVESHVTFTQVNLDPFRKKTPKQADNPPKLLDK